jgi:NTP pyrophosphatase (non-canonical NTP hydrolase)
MALVYEGGPIMRLGAMGEFDDLLEYVRRFRDERDWAQFHTCKNLVASIAIEAGELLERLQWNEGQEAEEQAKRDREGLAEEVADVMIYCLLLCDRIGMDPAAAIRAKLEVNARKYPVSLVRGSSVKPDRLGPAGER